MILEAEFRIIFKKCIRPVSSGLFLLILASSIAQNSLSLDSLKLDLIESSNEKKALILRLILDREQSSNAKVQYAEQLIEISQEIGRDDLKYYGFLYLGTAHNYLGNLELALSAYLSSIELAKKLGYAKELCEAYGSVADIYRINKEFEKASNHYEKAIEIALDNKLTVSLAINYLNIGYCEFQANNLSLARSYYQKVEELKEEVSHPLLMTYLNGNILLLKIKAGELTDIPIVLQEFQQVFDHLAKNGDFYGQSDYLWQLSNLLEEQGKIGDAIAMSTRSLQIAKQHGLKEQIRDASFHLAQLHKRVGNDKMAFEYLTQSIIYKDSITNLETIQKMADLRTQFEVGQKQAEVDLLTAQKKIQQLMLFAAVGFSLILIILASIIYKYYKNKTKVARILEAQKKELERLNQTKDKFFSIISHDLRGPVASFFGISRMIKYLVESKETGQLIAVADDIDRSVERLSNLLDNLLNWAMQQQGRVPNVPEKLEFTYLAMDLVATFKTMADSKKISLRVETEGEPKIWADRNMTMTIFRNLINNALKFTSEGGTVTLFASEDKGMVTAGVKDSGVGIPKEKLEQLFTLGEKKSTYGTSGEKGLGLGLQLVYEFIGLNNGEINVESEPDNGTTFTVKLPAFANEGLYQKIS